MLKFESEIDGQMVRIEMRYIESAWDSLRYHNVNNALREELRERIKTDEELSIIIGDQGYIDQFAMAVALTTTLEGVEFVLPSVTAKGKELADAFIQWMNYKPWSVNRGWMSLTEKVIEAFNEVAKK